MHRFYGISEKLEGLVYAECQDEQRLYRKTLKRKKNKIPRPLPLSFSRLSPAEKEQSLKSSQQVSSPLPPFFRASPLQILACFCRWKGGGRQKKEGGRLRIGQGGNVLFLTPFSLFFRVRNRVLRARQIFSPILSLSLSKAFLYIYRRRPTEDEGRRGF